MTSKLTLTIEEKVIEKAKVYARETGRSLSSLIQAYLEQLTKKSLPDKDVSEKLSHLIGSIKLPEDFNEKEELKSYFKNKY